MAFKSVAAATYYPYNTKRLHDSARRNAIRQFRVAIERGELVRLPCERCGRKRSVHGHHEDYSRPLDVMWLCRFHHAYRHAELREMAKALIATTANEKVIEPIEALAIRTKRQIGSNAEVGRGPIAAITVALAEALDAEGITENALAKRLGCSRQWMNCIFQGGVRTIRVLTTLADAIGYDVHITLSKRKVAA